MRIILSRKGFDTAAGGCPSPVFPDGSLLALPIPDARSSIPYSAIHVHGLNPGTLVKELTGNPDLENHGAHLDPDLIRESYPRKPGWQPLLGQTGSAQSHLRNQGVGVGDLFLFFGLFRAVMSTEQGWRFVPQARPFHALWGWLQIGDIRPVDELADGELPWARYHPHFRRGPDPRNTLYIAAEQLHLNGRSGPRPGAGVFPVLTERLRLTAPDASSPTQWLLPSFFYPKKGRPPLSYHHKRERWRQTRKGCRLQAVARGQEFVLDGDAYPEAGDWLLDLLAE
jgi:hypothetical protein